MSSRPNIVTELQEGHEIGDDVHRGWGATFNWLVSFFTSLKGDGVRISGIEDGRPEISVDLVAGNEIEIRKESDGTFVIDCTHEKKKKDDDDDNDDDKKKKKNPKDTDCNGWSDEETDNEWSDSLDVNDDDNDFTNEHSIDGVGGIGGNGGEDNNDFDDGFGNGASDELNNDWSDNFPVNVGDNCNDLNGWNPEGTNVLVNGD